MAEATDRAEGGEATPLAPSDLGRYQVFATLGRGGMADVYLAVARGPMGFNKLVVLKRLRPHLAEEPSFRDMFLDEARLAARLNHPNVIQSYEVGETQGSYFIAMEYLDGQPLNRVVAEARKRGEPMDPAFAARIVVDACGGLGHAHELRDYDGTPLHIIHRDVSPHNIFITYEGQVKLVDFGIAKAALSRVETEVGVLKGKVAYMAPEQATGAPIDGRADLFAMGIVLWELLAGRPLFTGENAANTLHRLMNEPIPTPSSPSQGVSQGVDPRLEAIVMRALAKDVAERFQSAREMRDALEAWLREVGRTVRSEEVGVWVASMFQDKRVAVQREIQRYMGGAGEVARASASRASLLSLASIEQLERAGGNASAQLVNLSTDSGAGMVSGLEKRGATSTIAALDGEKRKRRIAVVIFGSVLALLLLGVLVVVAPWRRPAVAVAPAPSATGSVAAAGLASAAPSALAAPTPPASASASPPVSPFATGAPVATGASAATATAIPAPRPSPRGRPAPARPTPPRPGPAPRPTPAPAPAPQSDGAPGYLTFDSYPWTRVSENGRVLGTTPMMRVALSPGVHTLMLENPDLGIRQPYTVTIKSGEAVTRRLGLR